MSNQQEDLAVTCPACGLLCDDIRIKQQDGHLDVEAQGCALAQSFFQQSVPSAQAKIQGKNVALAQALQAASDLLYNSKQSLFCGLGTDVSGMRALLTLVNQTGAYLDHMNSSAGLRNIQVLQQHGWQTTTLTEVKQRADVILIIGSNIVSQHPRFFQRILWQGDALFGERLPEREIIVLGPADLDISVATSPTGKAAQHIVCENAQLPEVFASLHALALGKTIHAEKIAHIPTQTLQQLVDVLRAAKYSVLTWLAKELDFPHAELCIQQITQTVRALNQHTRSSALPLGGSDGDYSVYQVNTWTTGFPIRNRFYQGNAEYDPFHFSVERLQDQSDVRVWISCFQPKPPPTSEGKTIIIGHPALQDCSCDVFIPVRIPGLQQSGTLFRVDSSVSLPIQAVMASELNSLQEVLRQIEEAYHAH